MKGIIQSQGQVAQNPARPKDIDAATTVVVPTSLALGF